MAAKRKWPSPPLAISESVFRVTQKKHRKPESGGRLVASVDVCDPGVESNRFHAQILNVTEMPDGTYTFTWVTWESPIRGPSTDSYTVPAVAIQKLRKGNMVDHAR